MAKYPRTAEPGDDPRHDPGAYVTDGKSLYLVIGLEDKVRESGDQYVQMENGKSYMLVMFSVEFIAKRFTLVRAADPNTIPDSLGPVHDEPTQAQAA